MLQVSLGVYYFYFSVSVVRLSCTSAVPERMLRVRQKHLACRTRSLHVHIKVSLPVSFVVMAAFGVCLSLCGKSTAVTISLYYHLSVPKYSFDRNRK